MYNSQLFNEDYELLIGLIKTVCKSSSLYIEVGCALGGTFCKVHNDLPNGSTTVAIDYQNYKPYWSQLPLKPENDFRFFFGSSDQTISEVKKLIENQYIDCVFIDGDHSEQGVWTDWNNYYDLVRPGGLIIFHDWDPLSAKPFNPNNQGPAIVCEKLMSEGHNIKQLIGSKIGTSYLIKK